MTNQIYSIKTITNKDDLTPDFPFQIKNFYWDSKVQPITTCHIAFLKDQGLYILMKTLENYVSPKYKQHQDPVYLDSAMEFFISIPGKGLNKSYFNIEVNSNGAVLAQFGPNRDHRFPLSLEDIDHLNVSVEQNSTSWTLAFILPFDLIKKYEPSLHLPFDSFAFNFYKICESNEYRHFGSFSPIESLTPNFHLPQFFALGLL